MKQLNIFRKGVIGLSVIFMVVLLIGLFLPSKYRVQRSVVIMSPSNVVYEEINNFKNWENWSPWKEQDSTAKVTFSGPETGIGSKMSWEGKKGNGQIMTIHTQNGNLIEQEMVFKNFEFVSRNIWSLDPVTGGTRLTWANEGELKNIFSRYGGLFMDRMMGKDFEKGLNNLKQYTEGKVTGESEADKRCKKSF